MYMKYGTQYWNPCMKIAIDILTDVSTAYTATWFFFDKEAISMDMQKQLN